MEEICPVCHSSNPVGARFCNNCGTALTPRKPTTLPEAPPPIPTVSPGPPGQYANPIGVDWSAPQPVAPARGGRPSRPPEAGQPVASPVGKPRETTAPAPARPRFPAIGNKVIGEVRELQQRSEYEANNKIIYIWTFRLERFDLSGNRLPPAQVELKAPNFKGAVSEGDWVEVKNAWGWRPGVVLRPDRVRNLTTMSWLEGYTPFLRTLGDTYNGIGVVIGILFTIAFCIFVLFLINQFANAF